MQSPPLLYRVLFVIAAVTGLVLASAALYTGLAAQQIPSALTQPQ
jgi:hypothetical protein